MLHKRREFAHGALVSHPAAHARWRGALDSSPLVAKEQMISRLKPWRFRGDG
jgi:hypothetical protein